MTAGLGPWALGLLGVMQHCVFMPNVISYNAAISACEKGKQRQQALGLLALMQQTAFLPDVISYKCRGQCLLKGLAMAGGPGSLGCDAADCCSAQCHFLQGAISVCEKGQQWQQALGLLAGMQQTVGLPNVRSVAAIISACEKGQQWLLALGLFAVMQQTAFLPDVISYNASISFCWNGQHWQQALDFLAVMQQCLYLHMYLHV